MHLDNSNAFSRDAEYKSLYIHKVIVGGCSLSRYTYVKIMNGGRCLNLYDAICSVYSLIYIFHQLFLVFLCRTETILFYVITLLFGE